MRIPVVLGVLVLAACRAAPAPELSPAVDGTLAVALPAVARLVSRAPHAVVWPEEIGLRGRRFARQVHGAEVTQFSSGVFDARALGWYQCERAVAAVHYTLTIRWPADGISAGTVTVYARMREAPCPAALAGYEEDATRMIGEVVRLAHWREVSDSSFH
ncbi:MAG: hypothetical protein C0497_07355 [Gemmatimonas sp.]|nr:hypothetical protein [Gemmatimonas sp.]